MIMSEFIWKRFSLTTIILSLLYVKLEYGFCLKISSLIYPENNQNYPGFLGTVKNSLKIIFHWIQSLFQVLFYVLSIISHSSKLSSLIFHHSFISNRCTHQIMFNSHLFNTHSNKVCFLPNLLSHYC